jgi:hypothetical protein
MIYYDLKASLESVNASPRPRPLKEYDDEGLLNVNAGLSRILGYPESALIGKSFSELVAPEYSKEVKSLENPWRPSGTPGKGR